MKKNDQPNSKIIIYQNEADEVKIPVLRKKPKDWVSTGRFPHNNKI